MLFFDQVGVRDSTDGFVSLTWTEYQLLYLLYLKDGELVSNHMIINRLQIKPNKFISQLRNKIGQISKEKYIETVHGLGYMLCKKIEYLETDDFDLDVTHTVPHSLSSGQKKVFTAFVNPDYAHLTERELAQKLGFKLDNFKYHRKMLYKEIGAVSRTHATQIAQQYYAKRGAA